MTQNAFSSYMITSLRKKTMNKVNFPFLQYKKLQTHSGLHTHFQHFDYAFTTVNWGNA